MTEHLRSLDHHTRAIENPKNMRWFFSGMSMALMVIVAVGFAPSFYLPGIFGPKRVAGESVPFYIVVHGVMLTLWYLLLTTQSLLVAVRHVRMHRTLGIAGAALAAFMVPLSLLVVVRSVARSNLEALPVLGDFGILALFSILLTMSIRYRRRPQVHKRLMLFASICLVAPAIARWPGAREALPLSIVLPQLAMFVAIIMYDLVTRRRVHPATVCSLVAYFVMMGVVVPLAMSDLGRRLVEGLS